MAKHPTGNTDNTKLTDQLVDEEAFKFVTKARDHFQQQRKDAHLEEEWKADERSYFNNTDDFYKGISKVRVPALHQSVEIFVPKAEKSTFPRNGKWFTANPDNMKNEVQREQSEQAVQLLKDQFNDIKARSKIIRLYRSVATYGTVFIKTRWEHKIKERFKRDTKNKRVKFWDIVVDNPNFHNVPIWDFYADVKDEDLEGLTIERIVKDFQELWENRKRIEDGESIGLYRNVEGLKTVGNPDLTQQDSNKTRSDEFRGVSKKTFGEHENKIEVFEAWGPIPKWFLTKSLKDKENKLFVDGLIVIAEEAKGKGKTLRIVDNPFDHQESPYIRARYIPVDGKLYGLGVMSVNVPLEAELNTLRNQAMDNRTFMLKNKWLKDTNAEIDDNALKDLAEQVIDTNNVNGLVVLRPPDFTPSTIAAGSVIKQDIEDSTGNSKLLGGTPSGSSLDRTASGIATVVQGGLDRLELVVNTFEDELLKMLLLKFWQLDQQFLPKGREVSVLGQELIRVEPRKISFPNINFTGIKGLAEKDFKANTLGITLQNVSGLVPFGLDPVPILFKQLELLDLEDLIPLIDKRPDQEQLLEETPEGEVQLLRLGRTVKLNFNDPHADFIRAYRDLLAEENLPAVVVKNTNDALGQRLAMIALRDDPDTLQNLVRSRKDIATKSQ